MKLSSIWSHDTDKNHYLAFVLDSSTRDNLIKLVTPLYDRVVCHHVTLKFDLSKGFSDKEREMLNTPPEVLLRGVLGDDGLQCLPVSVDGETIRPDGSFYHITHSLNNNRKPVESNKLKLENMDPIKGFVPIHGKVYLVKK